MPDPAPAPAGGSALDQIKAAILAAGAGQANQKDPPRGNAIGVPTFQIDPNTGFAAVGPDGKPLPWTVPDQTEMSTRQTSRSPGPVQPHPVGARYFDGQEWSEIGGLPPEVKAQIQQAMLDRGLYSSAKPRIAMGAWDNDSATAFKQVLAYANASGMTWDMALKNMPKLDDGVERNPDGSVKVKYGPTAPHTFTPFSATLTNPTDLRAVIKAGARSVLGQTLNDDEVSRFVQNYQQSELVPQEQQYNAQHAAQAAGFAAQDAYSHAQDEIQQTGTATTQVPTTVSGPSSIVTNPASPSNAAAEFARTTHPGMAGAHDLAGQFNNLMGLLSGIVGNTATAGSSSG